MFSISKGYRNLLIITILLLAIGLRVVFIGSSIRHVNVSGDESIAALIGMGITQPASDPAMQAKQYPRAVLGRFPLLFMAQPYLFPVDSYLAAPFIRWLPHNALGIRFTPTLLGIITVTLSIMILLGNSPLRKIWPGILLIIFPSAYILLLQGAYGLPGYPSSMFLSAISIFAVYKQRKSSRRFAVWAMVSGLSIGVACSGTILALPLLAGIGAMVCLNTDWKKATISTPAFMVGISAGMLPYFLAKHIYPGAHQAVSQTVPLAEAVSRLWSPTLSFTLPAAMGMISPIIPDSMETVSIFPLAAGKFFAVIWLVVMLYATSLCLYRFIRRTIENRWPSFEISDIFVGASWICLFLFVLTTRWGSHEFRYLMPLVWCFPFIVAALYSQSGKILRVVIGSAACLLAAINIATALMVMNYWSDESFDGYFTDVKPALEYMRTKNITSCYSSYFDAYVIDYLTDEEIICSQPLNERFFGWPLPYKALVDSSTNAAYVLGPSRRFMKEHLICDLEIMNVTSHKEICGKFDIHTNFKPTIPLHEKRIPAQEITFFTSQSPETAGKLNDGNRLSRWQSFHAQEKGMWVDVQLTSTQTVKRISMHYDFYAYDNARSINILAKDSSGWKSITNAVKFVMQPFEMKNNHPVYGSQFQTISFTPTTTDKLRIEIESPKEGRDWTIGEIEVYSQD